MSGSVHQGTGSIVAAWGTGSIVAAWGTGSIVAAWGTGSIVAALTAKTSVRGPTPGRDHCLLKRAL